MFSFENTVERLEVVCRRENAASDINIEHLCSPSSDQLFQRDQGIQVGNFIVRSELEAGSGQQSGSWLTGGYTMCCSIIASQ